MGFKITLALYTTTDFIHICYTNNALYIRTDLIQHCKDTLFCIKLTNFCDQKLEKCHWTSINIFSTILISSYEKKCSFQHQFTLHCNFQDNPTVKWGPVLGQTDMPSYRLPSSALSLNSSLLPFHMTVQINPSTRKPHTHTHTHTITISCTISQKNGVVDKNTLVATYITSSGYKNNYFN